MRLAPAVAAAGVLLVLATSATGAASKPTLGITGNVARFKQQVNQDSTVVQAFLGWGQGQTFGAPFNVLFSTLQPIPMWIIGIGCSVLNSTLNGAPKVCPCPQPRNAWTTVESWFTCCLKRATLPVIPRVGFEAAPVALVARTSRTPAAATAGARRITSRLARTRSEF